MGRLAVDAVGIDERRDPDPRHHIAGPKIVGARILLRHVGLQRGRFDRKGGGFRFIGPLFAISGAEGAATVSPAGGSDFCAAPSTVPVSGSGASSPNSRMSQPKGSKPLPHPASQGAGAGGRGSPARCRHSGSVSSVFRAAPMSGTAGSAAATLSHDPVSANGHCHDSPIFPEEQPASSIAAIEAAGIASRRGA